MIADLFQEKILGKSHLVEKMQQLADLDANALQHDLNQAITQHPKKIIVLTRFRSFYPKKRSCNYPSPFKNERCFLQSSSPKLNLSRLRYQNWWLKLSPI